MRWLRHYHQLPEPLRIVGTAALGSAIGYVTYIIVYALQPFEPRAPISWLLAFVINVGRQHALHRAMTFGGLEEQSKYWPSLQRAYVMYSGSAVITTALNGLLTVRYDVNHNLAWLACVAVTGLISLAFLRRYVFRLSRAQPASGSGPASDGSG